MEQSREKFASRLGFILISAGCAIGLGNVYRFPIITGAYGGGIFVLIYIGFLLLLGLPIMTVELAVGRGSQRSIASSFDVLEKKGQKWHLMKYLGIFGNYLLMMFYTIISGWMVIYFVKYLTGSIMSASGVEGLAGVFGSMVGNPGLMVGSAFAVILICFGICSMGLQKGVEGITKWMMVALFVLMIGLAVYSATLSNAGEGLRFYLIPSLEKLEGAGLSTVISAAMGQSFFTLSLGIGSIAIFGSYIGKERRLLGESVTIVCLDTFVALMSGMIIFPACFTYNNGVTADAGSVGASFLFTTLSSIFNGMPGGRVIGTLFFLFMIFAAFSTVIAVFENIMSFWLELTKLNRRVIALINVVLLMVLSLPCALSLNLWGNVTIFGLGIMDLEDFVVSNLLLPIGSLFYVLFCVTRYGWGWDKYFAEVNLGTQGIRLPRWLRPYMTYVLPLIILAVLVMSVFG
ncbi:MAG: sodium-dependent transporter [Candidatus Limiplasma sp.]|nr:sodium-dependent transporter [Clostridiales bacterium]MDY3243937.1 sodium-dependent transporter [Candidatus Limiplasma sp.]MDY4063071.1 sodium-dependent transporter [Candidatus Limiplasma sp.]